MLWTKKYVFCFWRLRLVFLLLNPKYPTQFVEKPKIKYHPQTAKASSCPENIKRIVQEIGEALFLTDPSCYNKICLSKFFFTKSIIYPVFYTLYTVSCILYPVYTTITVLLLVKRICCCWSDMHLGQSVTQNFRSSLHESQGLCPHINSGMWQILRD